MKKKIVILWNAAELTGTRTTENPRVPELRQNTVTRLEALGFDVSATADPDSAAAELVDAEVYYGKALEAYAFSTAARLKWIQTSVAGMEGFWHPEIRKSQVTITSVRGIYSDVIADHMYGFILSFGRGLQTYAKQQSLRTWEKKAVVVHLAGATLGLIGLGGIGLAVAERAKASGMRIIAVDPSPKDKPDYIETVYTPNQLHDLLKQSDFVAVSVPHLSETEHLMNDEAFAAMKETAYILNVGRGKVISLDALTRALESGSIAGAGLDVFEQEPLPDNHPLWDMENVLITPHCAGRSDIPYQEERRLNLLVENAKRFVDGKDLLNVFDKQKGYVP